MAWVCLQVLTSKACSEEGLEDATNLLLQLSWANNQTREAILQLLLDGARELGLTVCQHIRWVELINLWSICWKQALQGYANKEGPG